MGSSSILEERTQLHLQNCEKVALQSQPQKGNPSAVYLNWIVAMECSVQALKPLTDGLRQAGSWVGRVFCCCRGSKEMGGDAKREPLLHTA